MKKHSFLIIFLALMIICGSVFVYSPKLETVSAATEFGGIIDLDTTWTQENSPYTLSGNVLVENGVTLTIQPGTIVNLGSYYLRVNGTLQAIGSSVNQIAFNGGQITFSAYSANWTESTGDGCIIQNAVLKDTVLEIESTVNVSNNIISGSQSELIQINAGSAIIFENTIIPTLNAIGVRGGNPLISKNLINATHSYTPFSCGIYIAGYPTGTCSPVISENTIANGIVGIYLIFYASTSGITNISRNLIINNHENAQFFILSESVSSAGIAVGNGNDEISNYATIISNNTICIGTCGIVVRTAAPNTSIYFNNIFENQANLFNEPNETLNATKNWWGTTNPQNDATVLYIPPLTSPNTAAPTFVNASATAGGLISSSGITRLNYGDSPTFTITPDSGYHIVDVLVNGSSVGAVSSYDLQNICGATTISAIFAPDQTPTPTPTPTSDPTNQPTSNPTSNPTEQPTSTPAVPELPSYAAAVILILTTASALLYKTKNAEKIGLK